MTGSSPERPKYCHPSPRSRQRPEFCSPGERDWGRQWALRRSPPCNPVAWETHTDQNPGREHGGSRRVTCRSQARPRDPGAPWLAGPWGRVPVSPPRPQLDTATTTFTLYSCLQGSQLRPATGPRRRRQHSPGHGAPRQAPLRRPRGTWSQGAARVGADARREGLPTAVARPGRAEQCPAGTSSCSRHSAPAEGRPRAGGRLR